MKASDLVEAIEESIRGAFVSESELHARIAAALESAGIPHMSEVWLNDVDRIDLVVGRIGIELKLHGAVSAVSRQLQRYAQSDLLDELILVTARAQLCSVPRELSGKPVHVAFVGGGL